MNITLPLWSVFLTLILLISIIIALLFKLKSKSDKSIWKSLFTEGDGEISVGSVCVFMIISAYTLCLIYATYKAVTLPASPTEIATMSGSIYALKKVPAAWAKVTELKNSITGETK